MSQRFSNSGDGAKEIESLYNSWTIKLSEICIQACYATIGGLFAVFGTSGKLLSNKFAIASIIMVFLVLGANILVRKIIIWQLHRRIVYSENNSDDWEKEYIDYTQKGGQWPYTSSIDNAGKILRHLNVWGVLLAAVLLIAGVLTSASSDPKNAVETTTNSAMPKSQTIQVIDISPLVEELQKIHIAISNSSTQLQGTITTAKPTTDFTPLINELQNIERTISNSSSQFTLRQQSTNGLQLQIRNTGLFFHLGQSEVKSK